MLNEFLKENGFEKTNSFTGVYNNGIQVFTAWDGERKVVVVDEVQVVVSKDDAEIIEVLKKELAKKVSSKNEESHDAEVLAAEVAKNSEIIKYYADENNRGKSIMIKDALAKLKEELPKSINFSDFQKLVESHIL